MEIKGKIHCLFEQSGIFKNEFKKLGYEAFDYDIQNNHGETDYQIDLFVEIEKAYEGGVSIFDGITKDCLILAFFPCIYFENTQMMYYSGDNLNQKNLSLEALHNSILERIQQRHIFYVVLYKLFFVCERLKLRLILENPYSPIHYLLFTQNFYRKPSIIDKNRRLRGDYFMKPTAYWFFNCEPTNGKSFQKPKETKIVINCKKGKIAGICSEERSLISQDYARNFIKDFILGEPQSFSQLTLF